MTLDDFMKVCSLSLSWVSNPLYGLFLFIAIGLGNPYALIYCSLSCILNIIYCLYLTVPEAQIYNGLYGYNAVYIGNALFIGEKDVPKSLRTTFFIF